MIIGRQFADRQYRVLTYPVRCVPASRRISIHNALLTPDYRSAVNWILMNCFIVAMPLSLRFRCARRYGHRRQAPRRGGYDVALRNCPTAGDVFGRFASHCALAGGDILQPSHEYLIGLFQPATLAQISGR